MTYYISKPHDLTDYEETTETPDAAFWRVGELSKDQKHGAITHYRGPFVAWHWVPGAKRGEQVRRVRAMGVRGRSMWVKPCPAHSPYGCSLCTVGYVEDVP